MINHLKKQATRFQELLLIGLMAIPCSSYATTIETILTKTTTYLQGPVAKGVGVVAIVGSGYLCIVKQRLPKEQFAMVLLGLGIIFGGSSLYTTLVG